MEAVSKAIKNGMIEDKYGKRGTQLNENGVPSYSIPFVVKDEPKGTVSFAIVLEDKDAYQVTGGFTWVHWLAANITRTEMEENESIEAKDFVQGVNSWHSHLVGNQSKQLSSCYGGMTPPDAPHLYELQVFALDTKLDLENGFYLNELYKAMKGHILDHYTLEGIYNN